MLPMLLYSVVTEFLTLNNIILRAYFLANNKEGERMDKLNPENLVTEFNDGAIKNQSILGRHYTYTHIDLEEIFLNVGLTYAYDKITSSREEILVRWRKIDGKLQLYAYVYVDGRFNPKTPDERNEFFTQELPLAFQAIIYGDKEFLEAHKELYDAPVYVHFDSIIENVNRIEYWGIVKDYNQIYAEQL